MKTLKFALIAAFALAGSTMAIMPAQAGCFPLCVNGGCQVVCI